MPKPKRNPDEKRSDTVSSILKLINVQVSQYLQPGVDADIKRGLRMAYMAGRRHEASRLRRELKQQQELE